MNNIFLIPGLGADKRIYRNIKINNADITYIDWLEPERKDTLTTYAQKLIDQYHISDGSIVIGISLGGMLATEIALKLKLKKVVVISSIKSIDEAPFYFKIFKWLPLYKLIPGKLFAKLGMLIAPVFGKMRSVDAFLFSSMLQNTSPKFIKWAMYAALHWKNRQIPENVYHLAGNNDLIFNYKRIKNAEIIDGGTHIMIFDRAKEVSAYLNRVIAE